ncbi:hypothetical protein NL386_37625, partial [Klebsiella pneumoniae]|nr:hypothetical protein [Klebsiella pneumoniae]
MTWLVPLRRGRLSHHPYVVVDTGWNAFPHFGEIAIVRVAALRDQSGMTSARRKALISAALAIGTLACPAAF